MMIGRLFVSLMFIMMMGRNAKTVDIRPLGQLAGKARRFK